MKNLIHILFVFHCLLISAQYNTYHVTINGTDNGKGTLNSPLSLQAALNQPSFILPGDTILIHDGTYRGNFESELKGSESAFITVKNYNRDQVILDGNIAIDPSRALTINGAYTIYRNLIITNSTPFRDASQPNFQSTSGIRIYGHHVKCINLIVHNNPGTGIGFWTSAIDSEIYGCIIFHNGYQGGDRGHGHGIYTQNKTGTKKIYDNIIFSGFQYGIHAYTESGDIEGFDIQGNICFNNGILQEGGNLKANILIGGKQPVDRLNISHNHFFHDLNKSGNNLDLGYSVDNYSANVSSNHIVGGRYTCEFLNFDAISFENNLIVSEKTLVKLTDANHKAPAYKWNNNKYFSTSSAGFDDETFNNWQNTYGFDLKSSSSDDLPEVNEVIIRANKYVNGRAHLIIYNWEGLSEMRVDLSSALKAGESFKIIDVQNLWGTPVMEGYYDGSLQTIPLGQTEITIPKGIVPTIPEHTPEIFNVYLITSDRDHFTGKMDYSSNDFECKLKQSDQNIIITLDDYKSNEPVDIKIFDLSGKLMDHQSFDPMDNTEFKINIYHYEQGLYIMELRYEDKICTKKFVIS